MPKVTLVFLGVLVFCSQPSFSQSGPQYDLFTVHGDEMFWRYTYGIKGGADSLRREIVQMLRSKYYTTNIVKNDAGYNGEIQHYQVNPKKYGRKFINTQRIYWEGEFSGKFTIEVDDDHYRVTVYALYAEKLVRPASIHTQQQIPYGRYINLVVRKDRKGFKKRELGNVTLMSVSLKENFDFRTVSYIKD